MKRARNRRSRQRASHAAADLRLLLSSMKRMDLGRLAPRCRAKTLTGRPLDGHIVLPAILLPIMTFLHAKQQTAL